jgi:hypothetical protein
VLRHIFSCITCRMSDAYTQKRLEQECASFQYRKTGNYPPLSKQKTAGMQTAPSPHLR